MTIKSKLFSSINTDTPRNRPSAWRWVLLILTVLFSAFLVFQSLRPTSGVENLNNVDKIFHVLAYGVFAVLIGLTWPRLKGLSIFLIAFIIGVLLEFAQGAMGLGRIVSGADMVANGIGAALAVGFLYVIALWRA